MRRGTGTATGTDTGKRPASASPVRTGCHRLTSFIYGDCSASPSAQPQPTADFYATPYYCLRRLGSIDASATRGGKNYDLFRPPSAGSRPSATATTTSLILSAASTATWASGFSATACRSTRVRPEPGGFAWDPIFFEFCSALRGSLLFDFRTYRRLDEASRRLYLLLRKIFWRNEASPTFELRDIAVHTIGFSATHETYELKRKLWSCIQRLAKEGVIRLPLGTTGVRDFCTKTGNGRYVVQFHRGPTSRARLPTSPALDPAESALYEPLTTIGFEPAAIRRILAAYDPRLVAECADMTLAARERFGAQFFKKSPQAYFTDNIQKQSRRERTPPDWWRALRAEEELPP